MFERHDKSAGSAEKIIRDLFANTDIRVDGDRSWDITVHNPAFYRRVLAGGSLALGESYMDGWWDCESLDGFHGQGARSRPEQKGPPLSADDVGCHYLAGFQSSEQITGVADRRAPLRYR